MDLTTAHLLKKNHSEIGHIIKEAEEIGFTKFAEFINGLISLDNLRSTVSSTIESKSELIVNLIKQKIEMIYGEDNIGK